MFIKIFAVIVVTYSLAELIGYLFHRLAHVPGTELYKSHMLHHLQAYPPTRFSSEKYISIGIRSFVVWFMPIFAVFLGAQVAILNGWPLFAGIMTTLAVAGMNLYAHDSYHLSKHWLSETRFFKRLTDFHEVHHRNMKKNFGIYTFVIDKVFGTFKNPKSQ